MTDQWIDYLFGFAEHAAKKSKDSTQVGAVLMGRNREVLLTAFNGPPMGVRDDIPERRERPAKYLYASHAEQNLIAFAARNGIATEGMTVFVTHCPCANCAKSLIQAGIKQVNYLGGHTSMPEGEFAAAIDMFQEAKVGYQKFRINDGTSDPADLFQT